MAVVFARLREMVISYMKIDICQLINPCSLYARAYETQTTNATSCRFLQYATGLRHNFTRRNSHEIVALPSGET